MLSPLVGKTEYHVRNSKEFATFVKDMRVGPDEELRSYDVSALFTSVPVDRALTYIKERLENDDTLKDRTPLSPDDIIKLLGVCLKCTYFVYGGVFYLQIHGAAMGSPVSAIVCNLFMEYFEQKALSAYPHPPRWWKRYVDDTHTVLKTAHAQHFTEYLNTVDPDIKWTSEGETSTVVVSDDGQDHESRLERSLAFLDTLSVVDEGGQITTRVYRKGTHTDQYLNYQSNHPLEHKRGVVNTLKYRADSVISEEEDKTKESSQQCCDKLP